VDSGVDTLDSEIQPGPVDSAMPESTAQRC